MPIEIKELHIKINVDETGTKATAASSINQKIMKQSLRESIEQTMNIEQRKKER